MILESRILEHPGRCKPTWINRNQMEARIYTNGFYTGFFRRVKPLFGFNWNIFVKYGPEFHGIIIGKEVWSTCSEQNDYYLNRINTKIANL